MITLQTDRVILIHNDVIKATGGIQGIINNISLEGALARIENRICYEGLSDPIEIAAWYGYAIARAHAFTDGNKRTALVSMDVYLRLSNIFIDLYKNSDPLTLSEIMEKIAQGSIAHSSIVNWIKNN